MLDTALSIYNEFLDGIKKEYTGTVTPQRFVRIWNAWAMEEWIRINPSFAEGVELTQKQQDDLRMLRRNYLVAANALTPKLFTLPDGIITYTTIPATTDPLPEYLRLLKVMIKLDYDSNPSQECSLTGISGLLRCTLIKADNEAVIRTSPLRKPSDSRNYYRLIENRLEVVNDNDSNVGSNPAWIQFDYYKYPNEMSYDVDTGLFAYAVDLPAMQMAEIVKVAVRLFLQRVSDPRYQSFLNEEALRNKGNV